MLMLCNVRYRNLLLCNSYFGYVSIRECSMITSPVMSLVNLPISGHQYTCSQLVNSVCSKQHRLSMVAFVAGDCLLSVHNNNILPNYNY